MIKCVCSRKYDLEGAAEGESYEMRVILLLAYDSMRGKLFSISAKHLGFPLISFR